MRQWLRAMVAVMALGACDSDGGRGVDAPEYLVCCHTYEPCGETECILMPCAGSVQITEGGDKCSSDFIRVTYDCSACVPQSEWQEP